MVEERERGSSREQEGVRQEVARRGLKASEEAAMNGVKGVQDTSTTTKRISQAGAREYELSAPSLGKES
jgi:hypothetical protein